MIKGIIFDVGGVLHTEEAEHFYEDIAGRLRLNREIFMGTHLKLIPLLKLGKVTEPEYWKIFIKESGSKVPPPKDSLFAREFIRRFKLNRDTLELVKLLKKKGYKLAVMSDTIIPHRDYDKKMGIYDPFEVRVLSNEVGLAKPDPEMFKLTLRKLRVEPKEAVYIDDIPDYVEAAKRLGIHAFLFTSLERLESDLKKLKVV